MRDHLFNTEKYRYVSGKKPDVDCVLCAIRDSNPDVPDLSVFRQRGFIVSVNLYPFNPAHLLVFPERHILSPEELSEDEVTALHEITVMFKRIIDREFKPHGYNIGYNIGKPSGASIEHLHLHIVPRYSDEVGFLDIIGGARVVVVDPIEVMNRLRAALD